MRKSQSLELLRSVQSVSKFEATLELSESEAIRARPLTEKIDSVLRKAVEETVSQDSFSRQDLRDTLLTTVNELTLGYLEQSKRCFDELLHLDLLLSVATTFTKRGQRREPFHLDDLPFILSKDAAIDSALDIRRLTHREQRKALQFAHFRWKLFNLRHQIAAAEHYEQRVPASWLKEQDQLQAEIRGREKSLRAGTALNVSKFMDCMANGSIYEFAVPVAIALRTDESLELASEALRRFGRNLRLPIDVEFMGDSHTVAAGQALTMRFEEAGLGLSILAGWAKATSVIDEQRYCRVCYRHAATSLYCKEHASQIDGSKSRSTRLAERVFPSYLKRLKTYSLAPKIRSLLESNWESPSAYEPLLVEAAQKTALTAMSRNQAVLLASQLRQLQPTMSIQMKIDVQTQFATSLEAVARIEAETDPSPRDRSGRLANERRADEAKLALTLSGFFKNWCSGAGSNPDGLLIGGFDRNHPVVRTGIVASSEIVKCLLRRRAWTESVAEFQSEHMPGASEIHNALKSGRTKQVVASELGIGLSTLYKILKSGTAMRRRNSFG